MAKRASLTANFSALKATKGEASAPAPAPGPAASDPQPGDAKRGRGRPAKRPADTKVYGMTLRISGELRRALRRAAEDETDASGRVVSVHDVILEAVASHLARRGGLAGE